ncbi:hypothetical protein LPJGGPFB_02847 [Ensifer adhaerens]|uniref:hypothetical protein n=1 Tax=Ensifer adhaerens TaxID=106592 RepID=UPI00156945FA|nr:hypothetical protein [Ensifer adhaerens]NRP19590.1 hypothetical protein [Ensifer adhaerens]
MKRSGETLLKALEAEYLTLLIEALERCVDGRSGLFGQNDGALASLGKRLRKRLSSHDASELLDLGSHVDALRRKLGYAEPFPLNQRLLKMRSSNTANSMGEPKLARAWLEELSQEPGL